MDENRITRDSAELLEFRENAEFRSRISRNRRKPIALPTFLMRLDQTWSLT